MAKTPVEKKAKMSEEEAQRLGGRGAASPGFDAPKEDKNKKFPVSSETGRFHSLPFEEGYVVYNQHGQRATGVVSDAVAKDLILKNNRDAGIK